MNTLHTRLDMRQMPQRIRGSVGYYGPFAEGHAEESMVKAGPSRFDDACFSSVELRADREVLVLKAIVGTENN